MLEEDGMFGDWTPPIDDALDCAERVLPIFERVYPGDDRPRLALEAARAYALGDARCEGRSRRSR